MIMILTEIINVCCLMKILFMDNENVCLIQKYLVHKYTHYIFINKTNG